MKNQTYTEEQINGLLDKLNEIKAEHDLLRIEVALLRTLLTDSTLKSDSGLRFDSPAGASHPLRQDSSLSPSPQP